MRHGVDCPKESHVGVRGFLHDAEYDGQYDVDGVSYCGRCHYWMGVSVEEVLRMEIRNDRRRAVV